MPLSFFETNMGNPMNIYARKFLKSASRIIFSIVAIPILILLFLIAVELVTGISLTGFNNSINVEDITESFEKEDIPSLQSLVGGVLICAFSPKSDPNSILAMPGSPFESFSSNRVIDGSDASIWYIASIRRSEHRVQVFKVQSNRFLPDFEGRTPCGKNLALERARPVAKFVNIEVEDIGRSIHLKAVQ